jgi:2-haloacid dehalogenase
MDPEGTARRPAVVAFDVIETMFSLAPVRDALAPLGVGVDLYFARLLRDGFALAAAGDHRPFREVARSALAAVSPEATATQHDTVLAAFGELPAHPDAQPALAKLRERGVTVVTLTNGSAEMSAKLLESAGLIRYVERTLSVDDAGRWKPSPEPYRHAAAALARPAHEIAMVSAHAWDIHGAKRAGLAAGWCSRLEGSYSNLFEPPDVSGPDLVAVADRLLGLPAISGAGP